MHRVLTGCSVGTTGRSLRLDVRAHARSGPMVAFALERERDRDDAGDAGGGDAGGGDGNAASVALFVALHRRP